MNTVFSIKDSEGVIHLFVEIDLPSVCYGFDDMAESSHLIRVVKNKFGNIIVTANGPINVIQAILSNTNIIPNNKHFDLKYIKDVYYEKINKLVSELQYFDEPKDYQVYIVSEGKVYALFSDGSITEEEYYTNLDGMDSLCGSLYELEEEHGKEFGLKVIGEYYKIYYRNMFPCSYINTKDYKIELLTKEGK